MPYVHVILPKKLVHDDDNHTVELANHDAICPIALMKFQIFSGEINCRFMFCS